MPVVRVSLSSTRFSALRKAATQLGTDPNEFARVAVLETIIALRSKPRPSSRRRVRRSTVVAPTPSRRDTPAAPASSTTARTYQPKACAACGDDFFPTGPRSTVCQACKDSFAGDLTRPEEQRRRREVVN